MRYFNISFFTISLACAIGPSAYVPYPRDALFASHREMTGLKTLHAATTNDTSPMMMMIGGPKEKNVWTDG